MSSLIPNYSKFYYDYEITAEPYNGYIDINEGSGEIGVEVPVGSYTLSELALAVRNALNSQGTLDYVISVDRATRRFTISANANFSILSNNGTHFGQGIYSLLGLSTLSNYTGASTYSGLLPSGKCYSPQFLLQSYVSPDDWQEKSEAAVNVSASGSQIEVINFGIAKFAQFDIKFITNKPMDGVVIKNNPTGLDDARDFLTSITSKKFFEFIPDISNPNFFYKCVVEQTPDYQNGTGFRLKELWDQGLPGIFETGLIKVRVL